jgi:hypothetical protein
MRRLETVVIHALLRAGLALPVVRIAAVFVTIPAGAAYVDPTDPVPPLPTSPAASAVATSPEPSIVFSGIVTAPLVCTSKPDTPELTITDQTRITLANLTGADASVDTGTEQALSVADGAGVSVRFRPGQYVLRMVPDCTLTSGVDAAVLTVVTEAAQPLASAPAKSDPGPASSDPDAPAPDATDPGPAAAGPPSWPPGRENGHSPRPHPGPDPGPPGGSEHQPGTAEHQPSPSSTTPQSPTGSPAAVLPEPTPTPDPADQATTVGQPVIYDIVVVPWQEPGSDPRDARLLAIIALICVLGVTMASIRAILTHRARRTVNQ